MSEREVLYATIHDFVMREFLPGESPGSVTPDLNLIESGIIASLAVVHLADFLERLCGAPVAIREVNPTTVGTVSRMVEFVTDRRATAKAEK